MEFEAPVRRTMHPFRGKYYGTTPTDSSARAFGEIEVLVGDHDVALRIAGGLYMDFHLIPFDEYVAMRPEELYETDEPKKLAERAQLMGFKPRDGDGLQLIFMPGHKLGPNLMIRNWIGDWLGETLLWQAERSMASLVKKYVRWEDWRTNGGIPRLDRGGLLAPQRR